MELRFITILMVWILNVNSETRQAHNDSSKTTEAVREENSSTNFRDQWPNSNIESYTEFRDEDFDYNKSSVMTPIHLQHNMTDFDLRRESDIVSSFRRRKAYVGQKIRLWPDGRVPFVLSNEYTQKARAVIMEVMETFHTHTCIKFTPRQPADEYFIKIIPEEKCKSEVGMRSPGQLVILGGICLSQKGLIEHELMHTLGFYGHEHQRQDRDKWIRINWQYIPRQSYKFFKRFRRRSILDSGSYNYLSVLHFKNQPFQLDGGRGTGPPFTLPRNIPKVGGENLSHIDIQRIKKLYKCSGKHGAVPISIQT
ncbi:hatching enzyme 1.2-like [Brevipalpus obovatus]|uniref:hatching enzyme 1.2-like n=1 Tax=Brevipalpus obovatus TaxID=246614 RepID=UPI003D9E05A8